MKKIKLTQGKTALVDDDDFEHLSKFKWYTHFDGYNSYAKYGKWNPLTKVVDKYCMHHIVIGKPKKGYVVDHISGNSLDNRKKNLRICTHKNNLRNRGKNKNNTSGYKGVSFDKVMEKWRAQITVDGKVTHLCYSPNKKEAYKVYCNFAKKYHKAFAKF